MATAPCKITFVLLATAGVSWLSAFFAGSAFGETTSGYGNVMIGHARNDDAAKNGGVANDSDIVALSTTLLVPRKPKPNGTLFVWPGLQPDGANLEPIDNGVLQPVLSWGKSCAPGKQPGHYSSWWISAQYVNCYGHEQDFTGCSGGPIMKVNRGDRLTIELALSRTVWTQKVADTETGKVVTFDKDLRGQSQNYAYFRIEPYDARSIPAATFSNTTITFSRADPRNCEILKKGAEDFVSIPLSINGGQQCFIDEITLKTAPRRSACPQGGVVRSKNTDNKNTDNHTTVTFKNHHGETVNLYWLNEVGAREAFSVLKKGDSYTPLTYRSQTWIAMDQFNRCIDSFVVPDADSAVHIIH
jgi:hypothetical protein